jgi:hypothetical protein
MQTLNRGLTLSEYGLDTAAQPVSRHTTAAARMQLLPACCSTSSPGSPPPVLGCDRWKTCTRLKAQRRVQSGCARVKARGGGRKIGGGGGEAEEVRERRELGSYRSNSPGNEVLLKIVFQQCFEVPDHVITRGVRHEPRHSKTKCTNTRKKKRAKAGGRSLTLKHPRDVPG